MTCKHCHEPIIRCESAPSHAGCSSARGYLHDGTRAHGCQPRSDGPYAEPRTVHEQAREDVRQMWNAAFGHDP
jgi:hypothetical protein